MIKKLVFLRISRMSKLKNLKKLYSICEKVWIEFEFVVWRNINWLLKNLLLGKMVM